MMRKLLDKMLANRSVAAVFDEFGIRFYASSVHRDYFLECYRSGTWKEKVE